jgi:hypothetical protein
MFGVPKYTVNSAPAAVAVLWRARRSVGRGACVWSGRGARAAAALGQGADVAPRPRQSCCVRSDRTGELLALMI